VRCEDAELVALRIGQYCPGHLALADVSVLCTEPGDTEDLRLVIIRVEVDVEAVLG
jgi:hypothetical protein